MLYFAYLCILGAFRRVGGRPNIIVFLQLGQVNSIQVLAQFWIAGINGFVLNVGDIVALQGYFVVVSSQTIPVSAY